MNNSGTRADPARAGARGERTMTTDDREPVRDEELLRLLARWEAPVVPDPLDERVLRAYRREVATSRPWWGRLFAASIRVPVPVALALALLLLLTAALALRPAPPPPTAGAPGGGGPVQAAQGASPVVTGTSLAGFQPVPEVTATVVQEGTP
jgi:hypothetical protein